MNRISSTVLKIHQIVCTRFGSIVLPRVLASVHFGRAFTSPPRDKNFVSYILGLGYASNSTVQLYIPLTNRVRGPYRKLQTEFFPPRFMARALRAWAINRRGKNEDP